VRYVGYRWGGKIGGKRLGSLCFIVKRDIILLGKRRVSILSPRKGSGWRSCPFFVGSYRHIVSASTFAIVWHHPLEQCSRPTPRVIVPAAISGSELPTVVRLSTRDVRRNQSKAPVYCRPANIVMNTHLPCLSSYFHSG
jgi:hypothetical protein